MSETNPANSPPRDPMDLIASLALEKIELNLFRGIGPKGQRRPLLRRPCDRAGAAGRLRNGGGSRLPLAARLFHPPRQCAHPGAVRGRPRAGRRQLHHAARHRHPERRTDLQPRRLVPDRAQGAGAPVPYAAGRRSRNAAGRRGAGQGDGGQDPRAHAGAYAPPPAPSTCAGCRPAASTTTGRKSPTRRCGCGPKRPFPTTSTCSRPCWPTPRTWPSWRTALRAHGINWQTRGLQSASLDHAMWFHQPFDFNQWMLFDHGQPLDLAGARSGARRDVHPRRRPGGHGGAGSA